jgi:hypothetical protein
VTSVSPKRYCTKRKNKLDLLGYSTLRRLKYRKIWFLLATFCPGDACIIGCWLTTRPSVSSYS